MIELLMLMSFNKTIGHIARTRGRKAMGYQVLMVVLWFGGEIIGLFTGLVVLSMMNWNSPELVYEMALLGAAAGAWAVHFIVVNLQKPVKCPACGKELGVGYNYPQCVHCGAAVIPSGARLRGSLGSS